MKNKFIFSLVSFLIFSKPLIGQEKEELISLFNLLLAYLKYKPDLVHHFTIKPCIYGGSIARLLGVKNVINHITGLGPSFYSSRKKINFLKLNFLSISIKLH